MFINYRIMFWLLFTIVYASFVLVASVKAIQKVYNGNFRNEHEKVSVLSVLFLLLCMVSLERLYGVKPLTYLNIFPRLWGWWNRWNKESICLGLYMVFLPAVEVVPPFSVKFWFCLWFFRWRQSLLFFVAPFSFPGHLVLLRGNSSHKIWLIMYFLTYYPYFLF